MLKVNFSNKYFDRGGLPSLCSSLRGLSSTIQLRIGSSQPARACPWKFHNAAHTNMYVEDIEKHLNYLPTGCSYEPACLQEIVIRPLFEGDFC